MKTRESIRTLDIRRALARTDPANIKGIFHEY